ncbi:MAG: hypothetical protein ABSF54_28360, partial [Bryobacteraceae bacterium]
MKLISIATALCLAMASSLSAQTAQTAMFRAVMSSTGGDSGVTDVLVHTVNDSSGNILSASVDFNLAYQFPNDEVVASFGIAGGPAGFSSAISPILATAGNGRIFSQIQVAASNQTLLPILSGLLANPSQYSVTVGANDPAADLI